MYTYIYLYIYIYIHIYLSIYISTVEYIYCQKVGYRVAKTHWMPYLYRSFPAKEPYD